MSKNLCIYGCGQEAIHYFKTVDKWSCSKNQSGCPAIKQQKKKTMFSNYGVDNNMARKSVRKKMDKAAWSIETSNKRKQTNIERYGGENSFCDNKRVKAGMQKKYGVDHPYELDEFVQKKKDTNIKKYGTENVSQNKTIKNKKFNTRVSNGYSIPKEQWDSRDLYYSEIESYTNKSWAENFYKIENKDNLRRSNTAHLDHIYSKHEGFINDIPPEIIGHWSNLRLITREQNCRKHSKSDKSLKQLLEDYKKGQ